jgi:hypothetical protein
MFSSCDAMINQIILSAPLTLLQVLALPTMTWAWIAQPVLRLATGWTVRGSNPDGGMIFSAPVQTGPEAHPAFYTMGTGSFPGLKRPGRFCNRPPSYSAEVKESVELYLYSTFGPLWPITGWTLSLLSFTYSYSPAVKANLHFHNVQLSSFRVNCTYIISAHQLLQMRRATQVFFIRYSVKRK